MVVVKVPPPSTAKPVLRSRTDVVTVFSSFRDAGSVISFSGLLFASD